MDIGAFFAARWYAIGVSVLAGFATGVGGLYVYLLGKAPSDTQLAFVFSFAAGVMLCVSFFDVLLPQLVQATDASSAAVTLCSFALGTGLTLLAEHMLPSDIDALLGFFHTAQAPATLPDPAVDPETLDHPAPQPALHHRPTAGEASARPQAPPVPPPMAHTSPHHARLAVMMFLTLTAHNLPEGVAVALSTLQDATVGASLAVAVAVHNIPEGLAISVPVLAATRSRGAALAASVLSGLSEPLGALVTLAVMWVWPHSPGQDDTANAWVVDAVLSCVGGVMATVSFVELLPAATAFKGVPKRVLVGGFCLGMAVVGATIAVL